MSVDEKLSQIGQRLGVPDRRPNDGFDAERAAPLLADGIGHITRVSGASSFDAAEAADLANSIQRHLIEHTRLGIPAILHEEICSGLMAREAAVFPQALGVAATFRPELNRRLADAVRVQMRGDGSASRAVAGARRLPRSRAGAAWRRRTAKTRILVSQMGIGFITGLQGSDDGKDLRDGVVATAKHFVGYGASEGGMNWAPAHLPERELRDVYLRPFEAAVREAGLASLMNAYQELDGIPCAASRWLLTDLLRGEWGFDGTVVSDYFADQAARRLPPDRRIVGRRRGHRTHAGIDVELPSTECYGRRAACGDRARCHRDGRRRRGGATGARVEAAARSVRTPVRRGRPRRCCTHGRPTRSSCRGSSPRRAWCCCATTASCRWRPRITSIAVIGPNAANARHMLGDYSYITHVESLLEVLKSGHNVFAMPIDRGIDLDDGHRPRDTSSPCTTRSSPRCRTCTVRYAEGCVDQRRRSVGLRGRGRGRRGQRRRGDGDGRALRADRGLHHR